MPEHIRHPQGHSQPGQGGRIHDADADTAGIFRKGERSAALEKWDTWNQGRIKPKAPSSMPLQVRKHGSRVLIGLPTAGVLMTVMGLILIGIGAITRNMMITAAGIIILTADAFHMIAGTFGFYRIRLLGIDSEPAHAGERIDLHLIWEAPANSTVTHNTWAAVGERQAPIEWKRGPGKTSIGECTISVSAPIRGHWAMPRIGLLSTGPFGTHRCRTRLWPEARISVWPQLVGKIPADVRKGMEKRQMTLFQGDEMHYLRDYQAGDSPRLIMWKHSAKRDIPVVREMERQGGGAVIDWNLTSGEWEQRISTVATLLDEAHRQKQIIELILPHIHILPGRGALHFTQCMEAVTAMPRQGGME